MAIMFTGLATIGILAGSLASLFHLDDRAESAEEKTDSGEPRPLHEELAALRSELRGVDRRLGQLADRVQER
jgi:hypothetical protein